MFFCTQNTFSVSIWKDFRDKLLLLLYTDGYCILVSYVIQTCIILYCEWIKMTLILVFPSLIQLKSKKSLKHRCRVVLLIRGLECRSRLWNVRNAFEYEILFEMYVRKFDCINFKKFSKHCILHLYVSASYFEKAEMFP